MRYFLLALLVACHSEKAEVTAVKAPDAKPVGGATLIKRTKTRGRMPTWAFTRDGNHVVLAMHSICGVQRIALSDPKKVIDILPPCDSLNTPRIDVVDSAMVISAHASKKVLIIDTETWATREAKLPEGELVVSVYRKAGAEVVAITDQAELVRMNTLDGSILAKEPLGAGKWARLAVDDTFVAVTGESNKVRLFNTGDLKPLAPIAGKWNQVALAPKSGTLVVAYCEHRTADTLPAKKGKEHVVASIDTGTGKVLREYKVGEWCANLANGNVDNSVKWWANGASQSLNLETGESAPVPKSDRKLTMTHDAEGVALKEGDTVHYRVPYKETVEEPFGMQHLAGTYEGNYTKVQHIDERCDVTLRIPATEPPQLSLKMSLPTETSSKPTHKGFTLEKLKITDTEMTGELVPNDKEDSPARFSAKYVASARVGEIKLQVQGGNVDQNCNDIALKAQPRYD